MFCLLVKMSGDIRSSDSEDISQSSENIQTAVNGNIMDKSTGNHIKRKKASKN